MTNTSFTARHASVSIPFAFSACAFCTNPGRCVFEQVGVNAPGTENRTTDLPLNSSSVDRAPGPSFFMMPKVPLGTLSPTLMVINPPVNVLGHAIVN
jgi:hypothetical protein